MFEGNDKNLMKEIIFLRIQEIQIVYFCKKCNRKISTFWEPDGINGNFVALGSVTSELFNQYHADPSNILCYKCFCNLP